MDNEDVQDGFANQYVSEVFPPVDREVLHEELQPEEDQI